MTATAPAKVARFADVRSQGARFAAEMGVPLGAYQKMTAEEFFLMLSSPALGGPFATDPGISDEQGLVAAIVKCSPGQGPYLHAHYNTLESFTCLDGRFRITWGDTGEHEAVLEPFVQLLAGEPQGAFEESLVVGVPAEVHRGSSGGGGREGETPSGTDSPPAMRSRSENQTPKRLEPR